MIFEFTILGDTVFRANFEIIGDPLIRSQVFSVVPRFRFY